MKNNTPHGPVGERGEPAPLRVRLERIQWAKNDTFRDVGIVLPRDVKQFTDLRYGPYGEWNLLDVYRPENAKNALPVIVSVHGGGYFYGDRTLYKPYCMSLAQQGFAVVNFDYRLAPENRFPAPLEDVNAVLFWMAEHAKAYGLDTGNVFLVGDSAGAQIVSQYAAIYSDRAYAALFALEKPPVTLRAVGLNCGMYELQKRWEQAQPLMQDYFGPDFVDEKVLDVLAHIGPDYPPAFLLSAPNDFLYENCQPMADFINQRGGIAEAHIYGTKRDKTVGHVFHINRRCPEGKRANAEQLTFFRRFIAHLP